MKYIGMKNNLRISAGNAEFVVALSYAMTASNTNIGNVSENGKHTKFAGDLCRCAKSRPPTDLYRGHMVSLKR